MELNTRFTRLTVVGPGSRRGYWLCACDCGTQKDVRVDHLRAGKVMSCGCLHSELARARSGNMHRANTTHGLSQSRIHTIWLGMKQRCSDLENQDYGGRGIIVCERWLSFENFLADMGEPPDGHTLDRVNVDGNYEPGNCRWATRKEQQNNTRRNRKVTVGNLTLTISQWSDLTGIPRNTIDERLKDGWSADRAVTENNSRKQYRQTHCKRGHPLTPDNVYMQGRSRSCMVCAKERAKKQTSEKRHG